MRKGFTLIEVMVAITVFAVGCVGVLGYLWTSIRQNNINNDRTTALTIAEQQYSELEALAFESLRRSYPVPLARPIGILGELQKKGVYNQWFRLTNNHVSINGATALTATNNRFAIGYLILDPHDCGTVTCNDFIRGAIRVVWGTNGNYRDTNKDCDELLKSRLAEDTRTLRLANSTCDYVTVPFAFQWTKPATAP